MRGDGQVNIRIGLWSIFLMIVLCLSACGRGEPAGGQKGAEPQTQTSSENTPDKGQTDDLPLKGKNVTLIVPFSPGGGFDTYARMIAPFLEKHSGATVVVQNITGGGGIIGANHLYTSQPDGTTIGIMGGTNLIFSQTSGAEGVQYEVNRYTFLGRVTAEPNIGLVAAQKPYQTMEDLANADHLKMAATGLDDDYFTWSVIAKAFNIQNFEMITGWEGNSQWLSALAAGDIDGGHTSVGSALPAINNGYARAMLQVSEERHPGLQDVPTALELLPAGDPNRELVQTLTNAWVADRVIVAPPGMDEALADHMRDVIERTLTDPELVAQAEQAQRPIVFRKGSEIQAAIEEAMQSVGLLRPIFEEAAAKIR